MKQRRAIIVALMLATITPEAQDQATPAAVALRVRRDDAERRAMFAGTEPISFTLEADFGTVLKDRDPNSTKVYPAVVRLGTQAESKEIPVRLSVRGHSRRLSTTCEFVPLRLEFPKDAARGTVFEMRASGLKLVTHCRGSKEHQQYVLREYLAYRIANIMTPRSFRARLATATYVDAVKAKTLTTRYAMFLEDDDDVARRLEGKIRDDRGTLFNKLNQEALNLMMIFEFMIANTDYSIINLHNIRIVEAASGEAYAVPYDFDLSGLVNTPYAIPNPRLRLKAATDRLYRGPCRTPEQLAPALDTFRAKKKEVLDLVQSLPDLHTTVRVEMKRFLNEFYSLIDRQSAVQRYFIEPCVKMGI